MPQFECPKLVLGRIENKIVQSVNLGFQLFVIT